MIGAVIPRIILQFLSTHSSWDLGVVEHCGGHQDPQEKGGYMQKQKSSYDTKQPGSGPCLQSGAEGRIHFGQVEVFIVVIGGAGGQQHFEYWFHTIYILIIFCKKCLRLAR